MRFFLPLALLLAAPALQAQDGVPSAEDDVRAVVTELFDAMRAADSSRVRAVFHADARLHTTMRQGEDTRLVEGSLANFLTAVGTPHDEMWDERVDEIVVHVDDGLATAWMDYAFYAGEQFSHCGVNAIQLVQTDDGWKMLNLIDTRRRECEDTM
ncbi:MAG: DUF4440 domain-containing protein [Rhodothermaceae bacterium]|nr:DUF4440 domain-containing protein [Rhodothermaceae bacterium]